MSLTCGFFNAVNHDRKYNATEFSQIFDGLINDGIYATIGDHFIVTAYRDNTVKVGSGRAWFNHTWTYNDSMILVTADLSDQLLPRIDALVLEIDTSYDVRANSIKFVNGNVASSPEKPQMKSTDTVVQYPLCYVYRPANSTSITQNNITNTIGTSECPFVTGILETISVDDLILQWRSEFDNFMDDNDEIFNTWWNAQKNNFTKYYNEFQLQMNEWESEQRTDFSTFYSEFKNQVNSFENQSELDFNTWFAGIKEVLDSNTAGKLQNEIDEIIETEFNRYYNLFDSLSVINYNNDTIVTTTDEATMTTKITEDTSSETIITTISPSSGNYNYTRTIVITSTNSEDTVKTTYTRIVKEV
jgi:hypothetical protein